MNRLFFSLLALALALPTPASAQGVDPTVTSWQRNLDGTTGSSQIPSINSSVSRIAADVSRDRYTTTDVYIEASGIPSHDIGPWGMNPNSPTDQNHTFRIPRSPQPATNPMATGLGPIGVLANGVPMFNAQDARSWNNQGVWNQNAIYFEGQSMDTGLGHPAPRGQYHYHQRPSILHMQRGDNGVDHSPIIGFAFDGFPVYGHYAYANTDGTGGVVRMRSGFQVRNMTQRNTLPDGTQLSQNQWGPNVSNQYPLGAYVEDYAWVAGLGDLDQHNGRFGVTPEYPQGTYAYFSTIDAAGVSAYPYLVGPSYYGVPDAGNFGGGGPPGGGGITVPSNAIDYAPFSLYQTSFIGGATAKVSFGDAPANAILFLGFSAAGMGPVQTPIGTVLLSFPATIVGPFTASGSGDLSLNFGLTGSLTGITIYSQAIALSGTTATLSPGERIVIR